jgi:hypothetical protein
MANWCNNSVVFSADEATLDKIRNLFMEIQQKQEAGDSFQLPSFAKSDKGVMRDIIIGKHQLSFETRWEPNLELMIETAQFYGASFVSRFSEMANGICGEASFSDKTLRLVTLEPEDFMAIRYDPTQRGYPWGDEVFEYEGDLLDHILDRKIAMIPDWPTNSRQAENATGLSAEG